MRKARLTTLATLALASLMALASLPLQAEVVRPAPNFTWMGPGSASSLRAVKGQPVVLVMAQSPKSRAFRKQAKILREIYQQFAARGVIFAAAFATDATAIPSDIPFAVAQDGPSVLAAYGTEKGFRIAVIGKDGNLDYSTDSVVPAARVRDIVQNSFEMQTQGRE